MSVSGRSSEDSPQVNANGDIVDTLVAGGRRLTIYKGPPSMIADLARQRVKEAIKVDAEARERTRALRRQFAIKQLSYARSGQEREVARERILIQLQQQAAEQRRDGLRLERLVRRDGGIRPARDRPLKRRDLYLTDVRPPQYPRCKPHHLCGICDNLKSHPVSYVCGHSHCYVCIRVWLERSWLCPVCEVPMRSAPFRHDGEERGIAAEYPGLADGSAVDYSWEGLRFPAELREAVPYSPLSGVNLGVVSTAAQLELGRPPLSGMDQSRSAPYRCQPPWHPDDPRDLPRAAKKLYLATGPELGTSAGAYNSWPSANRVISGSRGASAPLVPSWDELVVIWQVGCAKGEHEHPSGPPSPRTNANLVAAASPATPAPRSRVYDDVRKSPTATRGTPASYPTRSTSSPRFQTPTASGARTARGYSPLSPSPSPSTAGFSSQGSARVAEERGPPAARSYGVRWQEKGMVLGSFVEAMEVYEALDSQGLCPRMLTTCSSADAVSFAEGFSTTAGGPEALSRREKIESQEDAHRARGAQDGERVATLQEWEEIRLLRERLAQLESRFI
ncbi:hypothetical protein B0H11DRAFT_2235723 [Mycena galericulata]|nr:hypothetical protein B0H11DRAFT_2235723 [Mycena galericulata]